MARTRSQKSTSKKKKTSRDVSQPTASSGTPSPCSTAGQKRLQSNNQASSNGKRQKSQSLTTEDIPEIVSAVVEALPQPGSGTANSVYSRGKKGTSRPISQRTRSQESRSGQSSRRRDRRNREASPDNTEHEESSDEDSDNEDFGKSNRLCHMHLVITVLITYMHILFKAHRCMAIACFI